MLNINYTLKTKIVDLKSDLTKPLFNTQADIYLDKMYNWLQLETEFSDISSFKSEIYEVKRYKNSTKIKTNTTAISLTDIVVNSTPYYYKLNIKSNKNYSIDNLKKLLNLKDLVIVNNTFYTNTEIYLYESNDEYIFTEKVIPKTYEVTYKSKYIEIITNSDIHFKLDEYVISPKIINSYMMYIPSFYVETIDGKFLRCIDSNIQIFESSAQTTPGNFLRYKIEESSLHVSKDFNIFFGTDQNEKLKFRTSSNCIFLKEPVEYFKILPNGSIIRTTKKDFTFKITKKINVDNINIIPNNYKFTSKFKNNIAGTIVNSIREENKDINDFAIEYRDIQNKVPKYIYLKTPKNYIFFSNGAVEYNGIFKEKSLYEDAFKIESIGDDMKVDTSKYIVLDNKNYEVLDDN